MRRRKGLFKFIIWSVISVSALYWTPGFVHAYNCRKTAIVYLDNLIHQNLNETVRYICFYRSDENRICTLQYSDIKKKWIDVMKLYREESTYVKSYKNLSIWPLTLKTKGKVSITIVENGLEKTYNTEITFGSIHGRIGILDIGVNTRFGKVLSGTDIDIL